MMKEDKYSLSESLLGCSLSSLTTLFFAEVISTYLRPDAFKCTVYAVVSGKDILHAVSQQGCVISAGHTTTHSWDARALCRVTFLTHIHTEPRQ